MLKSGKKERNDDIDFLSNPWADTTMSSTVLDRLRSTLARCAEIEEKLTALSKRKDGKSSGGGSNTTSSSSSDLEAKASKLRTKLCESYCEVLLCDPDFALRRDVPSRLWKACFYNRINELRGRATKERGRMKKSIRRADKDAAGRHRQAVEDVERSLKKFLGEAMALYHYLISQYEQKLLNAVGGGDDDDDDDDEDGNGNGNGGSGKKASLSSGSTPVILSNSKSGRGLFDPNNDDVFAIARKEQESKKKKKNNNKKRKGQSDGSSDDDDNDNDDDDDVPAALVPILYKSLLFLGDLQRYAMEHEEATECYAKASRLAPGRGNPYNQLAVVAQVSEQSLQAHPLTAVALYWYCRSLLADEAFETSQSNMERLFVMNQKWVAENIAAGTDGGIVDTISGGGGGAGAGNDDASEVTEAASTSHMSRGSRSSNNRNRKAQLEANRAAKSAMSRKFLAQFVDVHYDIRNLTKAIEEAAAATAQAGVDDVPVSLTPMVSNSRKDQGQQQEGGAQNLDLGSFDFSALLQRISTLEASLSSLLTIAAFSDALLCKLVCINAYSYFKASSTTAGASSEEINAAELLSATMLLSFGATVGRQLDWNLSKIKKKKKKDGTDSRQQQQQLSVRLLSPFVVLCDLISQFYGGSGNGQADGVQAMMLPLGIRQGKYSSSKGCDEGIAAAFSKAQYDFWTQVAAVANTVRSMDAFTTLVNTTSACGMDDVALRAFPLPKEYGDFRGFAPFAGVFASYETSDYGLGSGKDAYLSAEKAVTVLDLSQSQSQTQSQGSASGQKSKESNKSSAEAHARVLHFLLFLKRHSIDPERGAPKMEEGQYLFEEKGKLASILDSSALNSIAEDDGDDDNVANLGSDNDDNDMDDDTDEEDVDASETTRASPSLAGGFGQSGGSSNLLQYKKGTDSGPALLVPTMFGAGDGNASGAAASTATDVPRIAQPQPSAMDAPSTVKPASSVASQPSLMSGVAHQQQHPHLHPHARQGMDGVVLEGINQQQPLQQQDTSSGPAPPGFASGAGLTGNAPPPPGMMQPSLFAQAPAGSGGGLSSTGLSFQEGSSSLNTVNPFVPMPSSNQNMNSIGSGNLLFPPPQSSLFGGASTGFGVTSMIGDAGAGNNGGDLVSSLLGPTGGIFGSVEDILNVSSEHDDEKNATGNLWSQHTSNPFAANIK